MNSTLGFITLKMLPMFFLVLLGFLATRLLKINKESFAKILIYFLTPVTVFWGALQAPLEKNTLWIPVFYFGICSSICLLTLYTLGNFFFSKNKKESHLLAFGAGNANSGYFAIPIGTAIFGEGAFPLIVLTSMGFILYENTVGFFIAARGSHSIKQSLKRVVKLPSVYAFFMGLFCAQFFGRSSFSSLSDFVLTIRHTYSVLGMMLIGMGMGSLGFNLRSALRYTLAAQVAKFCIWPLGVFFIFKTNIFKDMGFLGSFEKLPLFTAFLPMAANTVAIAAEVQASVERAAIAVLLSTLLAWVVLPLILSSTF